MKNKFKDIGGFINKITPILNTLLIFVTLCLLMSLTMNFNKKEKTKIIKENKNTVLVVKQIKTIKTIPNSNSKKDEIKKVKTTKKDNTSKKKSKKKKYKHKKKKENKSIHYEVFADGEWHRLDDGLQDYLISLCSEKGIRDYVPLILCQLYIESKYDPYAVSSTNDYGLAQINGCNFDLLASELGITNLMDPYQSIQANVYFMGQFLTEYSPSEALSKYNTGQPYYSTEYSDKILALYNGGCWREV